YFRGSSAIGRVIELIREIRVIRDGEEQTVEEREPYTVTGVVRESPDKTHLPAKIWFHFEPQDQSNWLSASFYNYVLVREGLDAADLRERLETFVEHTVFPTLERKSSYEEWIQTDGAYRFSVVPLTDIYLKSDQRFEFAAGGSETNVQIFALVALFIVIIAAVNFVNITTARSVRRAKEVGIRKTLGTGRRALILQFLAESVLISVLSLVVAVGLAELFLTLFERFTGIELLNTLYSDLFDLLAILGITIVIGLLAGIYPALSLSSFRPVEVLKGDITASGKSLFRNALVAGQFTISLSLLACTGLIFQQIEYMQTRDLGLDMDHVLVIQNAGLLGEQKESFRDALLGRSGIEKVSYNSRIPMGSSVLVKTFRTQEMEEGRPIQLFWGDHRYLSVMGFRLLEGRDFSMDIAADTSAVILNRSAVRALGLEQPIGARLNSDSRVIGVVSDFNYESLRQAIEPAAIMLNAEAGSRLAAKLSGADISGILGGVREVWERYRPDEPMNYYFLDQSYARLLEREQMLGRAVTLFAFLAVLISCLGLYGLSAYICEQRTKEIGIRKVLGATTADIVLFLNKNFTKPVLVSILISIPLAAVIMDAWLDTFAYKTEINPWVFGLACLAGLAIAWGTVSWQSIKTALKNPIDSLRTE
ncbi:MAG: FtsX-like permease family protein, partial [Balneolaceae bacterium]|nr:FtsX-like permease family protein [Balneolaceae bacterium]